MPITAPLKLPYSFVHLALDAMLRSDMEKGRQVSYLKGRGPLHGLGRFHFDQDD